MQFPRKGGVICSFRGWEGLYAVFEEGRGSGYMQFPMLDGVICSFRGWAGLYSFRGREGFYAVSEVGRGKYSSYAPSNKVSSSSIQLCRVSFT